MRHYFLDTNVVMDYLAQRPLFWADAAELMQTAVNGETVLYVSSLSFSTIYYVLRRQSSPANAREAVRRLAQLVRSDDGRAKARALRQGGPGEVAS